MRRSRVASGIAIQADDLMGYGKSHPEDQWWLDLEEEGGVLRPPKNRAGKNLWDE